MRVISDIFRGATRVLMLGGVLLTGCAKPYNHPLLETIGEPSAAHFDGILSYARQGPTRVVWLHGMCTHPASWAQNRNEIFTKAGGLKTERAERTTGKSAFTISYHHTANGNPLEMRYLIWSPLTAGAKSSILDYLGDLETASLNEQLKSGLINDCLSDAVIYTGSAGDPIRAWIKQQICTSLGGHLGSAGCTFDRNATPVNTVFVAESLGSKLLSDAVLSLWQTTKNRTALARQLSSVQTVFYLANQIPILSAATYGSPREKLLGAGDGDLMSILSDAREQATIAKDQDGFLRPLHFVSFTDPNDLLSYRLLKGSYIPPDVRVTNVIVSNDDTYLGLIERPDTAHCGYGWNANVIGMLTTGFRGSFEPIKVDVPKSCGLGD